MEKHVRTGPKGIKNVSMVAVAITDAITVASTGRSTPLREVLLVDLSYLAGLVS